MVQGVMWALVEIGKCVLNNTHLINVFKYKLLGS